MKLENKGGEFELKWDGRDFTIPKGKFEVNDEAFGRFIETKAKQWGKDVRIIEDKAPKVIKKEIKKIEEPTVESVAERSKKTAEKKK